MAVSFSTLPIISLAALSEPAPSSAALAELSQKLDNVFSTTGFAYLVDLPLTYSHDEVFGLCDQFFNSEDAVTGEEKRRLSKKSFVKENSNTYRGYFPAEKGSDNLKEGFEIGPAVSISPFRNTTPVKINLTEPNVWPSNQLFQERSKTLHSELQNLSSNLLCLLAVALGKDSAFFAPYLDESISTLRLLHYPPVPKERRQELICTPHTDSGILTLLHQDPTGGLEVLNSLGEWVSAPYVPGSVVVNIGDLMAKVSGGRYVATYHRVRSTADADSSSAKGRYSVPFFFEPGANCVVKSVTGDDAGVVYGEHVLGKMSTWIEFQDVVDVKDVVSDTREPIAAY